MATAFNDPALMRCGFELTWPVAELPLQIEPVHQYTLYLYLDTTGGWVLGPRPG